eukprot:6207454-Pleurochrysis_carterae.AAC.3
MGAVETCDEIEARSHDGPIVDGRTARQFARQNGGDVTLWDFHMSLACLLMHVYRFLSCQQYLYRRAGVNVVVHVQACCVPVGVPACGLCMRVGERACVWRACEWACVRACVRVACVRVACMRVGVLCACVWAYYLVQAYVRGCGGACTDELRACGSVCVWACGCTCVCAPVGVRACGQTCVWACVWARVPGHVNVWACEHA